MSEQAQVGDTVRLTITTKGKVFMGIGRQLHVDGYDIAGPGRTIEILSRATPPLPSEPGTFWLDLHDDIWKVNEHGRLYYPAAPRMTDPEFFRPFRQLVLK